MTPVQAVIEREVARRVSHMDRIRLGWDALRECDDEEEALELVREALCAESLRPYAFESAYHETMTRALIRLIHSARSALPARHSFGEFCLMYPELLRSDALALYYSGQALRSVEAGSTWIDPDIRPLPPRAD